MVTVVKDTPLKIESTLSIKVFTLSKPPTANAGFINKTPKKENTQKQMRCLFFNEMVFTFFLSNQLYHQGF